MILAFHITLTSGNQFGIDARTIPITILIAPFRLRVGGQICIITSLILRRHSVCQDQDQ